MLVLCQDVLGEVSLMWSPFRWLEWLIVLLEKWDRHNNSVHRDSSSKGESLMVRSSNLLDGQPFSIVVFSACNSGSFSVAFGFNFSCFAGRIMCRWKMSSVAVSPSLQSWVELVARLSASGIQRRRNIDNWGGADIHIFVFTDCKNNRFQKKLIGQNTNIWISAPPIIDIPAPLLGYTFVFQACERPICHIVGDRVTYVIGG
jgi:hypothetical protein